MMNTKVNKNRVHIENLHNKINYLNPIAAVDRGYGIVLDKQGNMISSIEDIRIEENLNLIVKDGMLTIKVVKINKGEFHYE